MITRALLILIIPCFSVISFGWSQEPPKPSKVSYEYYDDGTIKSKTKTKIIVPIGGDMGDRIVKTIYYNEEGKKVSMIKKRYKMTYLRSEVIILKEKEFKHDYITTPTVPPQP